MAPRKDAKVSGWKTRKTRRTNFYYNLNADCADFHGFIEVGGVAAGDICVRPFPPRADRFSRYARSFGHLGGVLNEPPSRASAPLRQQAGARRATI